MALYSNQLKADKPTYIGTGFWHLNNLTNITVLFGRNGSGKSALLKSLLNADTGKRHLTSPERAGEINFNSDFAQQENSSSTRAANKQSNLSLQFRERAISRINTLLTKRGFHLDGSKVDNSINDIELLMKKLLPDFDFKIKPEMPFFTITRISDNQNVTNKDQLSSGEAEMVSVGLDILTICGIWKLEETTKRMLLIDEPDTHLHPDLQQHLADFIITVMEKYEVQVIVATHSTTLLSSLGFYGKEKTSVIYLNSQEQEQKAIKFEKTLQELATCLGGHALMGPLFNVPILLVEGDDDYKIWSQVPRHQKINLAAIPCGGEEIYDYQKTLEKLLSSLINNSPITSGFALLDKDKSLPDPSTVPQNRIKFIQLSCHEAENLYLTNEVLAEVGVTWDEAKQKIKAKAGDFSSKATILNECDAWDRKEGDFKDIINEVAFIIDPKNVPWTRRVGSTIGKNKPTGELADFLGATVIDSFWT